MKKEQIKNILFNASVLLIMFIFMNIFISSTLFIFKISINKMNCILALIITIVLFIIYSLIKKENLKNNIISILLFLILMTISLIISNSVYDSSWDGNSYHKTAIGALKNGWNPNYEQIEEFNESDKNEQKNVLTHKIWNNHYPKAVWIFSANIYSITENIESGKSINFMMLFALLLMTISYTLKKFNICLSVIVSILVTLNPVSVSQLFTYYNDGLIYMYIIALITVLLNLLEEDNELINYTTIVIILATLINIKFTGFAYAGITTLFFYIYILLNKKSKKSKIIKLTIAGILSLIIGVGLIGYSTYIKNFINNGHPFYPLFGEEKIDIITNNQPKEFKDMNRFKKFVLANFSESNNITYQVDDDVTLKIPFTIKKNEFSALSTCDLRIGGFGVLFSGIFIISVIIILVGMYFMYFSSKKTFFKISIILLLLTSLVIILEEAWWARYLPQLYILPFIAIYFLYYFDKKKISNILIVFLILLLSTNLSLFFKYNMLYRIRVSNSIRSEINLLNNENIINVYSKAFDGAIYNLYDKKLKVNIIQDTKEYENDEYINKLIYCEKLNIYELKEKEK